MNKFIGKKLVESIGQERYDHSIRVMETAILLGKKYKIDIDKVSIAAILHDCAKFKDRTILLKMAGQFDIILDSVMEYNLELIHGPLGAKIAEVEYGIKDMEILEAIKYHTTARENMTTLDKIIYIADYIEPKRNFIGIENVRDMAFEDLDKSILLAINKTIIFLIETNKLIHPDTIKARNYLKILKET